MRGNLGLFEISAHSTVITFRPMLISNVSMFLGTWTNFLTLFTLVVTNCRLGGNGLSYLVSLAKNVKAHGQKMILCPQCGLCDLYLFTWQMSLHLWQIIVTNPNILKVVFGDFVMNFIVTLCIISQLLTG